MLRRIHAPWHEALALTIPLGLFAALNFRAASFYFMRDDPCLLASALDHGIAAHFTDASVWRSLSSSLLMPWQILSLGLDLRLFGLEPGGFYAHHLASFAVVLVLAYLLLRKLLPRGFASLALVLFVATPQSVAVAELLMNRHYVEGLGFAVVSLLLATRALRGHSPYPALGSAIFYALAALAKEVFVPLPALVLLLPDGTLRDRLRVAMPHGGVALGYGVYRAHMLGWNNLFETYGSLRVAGPSSFSGYALVAILAVVAAVIRLVWRSPGRLSRVAVVAFLLAAPLSFVTSALEPRHFFVPTLVASTIVALALAEMHSRRVALVLSVLAVSLVTTHLFTSGTWRFLPASARHYRAEGAFLSSHEGPGVLLTSLGDTTYLSCLRRLSSDLGATSSVRFCGEPCLCDGWFGPVPQFRYAKGRIEPARRTATDPPACTPGDLEVSFRYEPAAGRVSWDFGPHEQGSCSLLLVTGEAPGSVSVPLHVPRSGSVPLFLRQPLRVLVSCRSAEGELTFSELQTIAP